MEFSELEFLGQIASFERRLLAPRPALSVMYFDVNADGRRVRQARSAQKLYFERYSPLILQILMYVERLIKYNLARHFFQIGVICCPKTITR